MESERDQILTRMRESRGYIMRMHEILAEHDPDFLNAYDTIFTRSVGEASPLPARFRELLVMALDIATEGTPKMVAAHASKAVANGATVDEVVATIEIACLVYLAKPLRYLDAIISQIADADGAEDQSQ